MALSERGDSRPYLALGLTFLLIGLGYANPWPLVTAYPAGMWEGELAPEVLNLYALVVFLGWAHFFYAWQGQWRASGKLGSGWRAIFWGAILLALVTLAATRNWMGVGVFSLVVWVYNIAHFIKAEVFFAGKQERSNFYSPVVAFAWFTLLLFRSVAGVPAVAIGGSVLLATGLLFAGDWKVLAQGQVKLPVLTLFLLGETLVWTAYGRYMTPSFRVGVYVFHVAGASFFHYLSSYFYAGGRGGLMRPWVVIAVNMVFLGAGYATGHVARPGWASVWLGPGWFTLWVALHLIGSDLLPWWKRMAKSRSRLEDAVAELG